MIELGHIFFIAYTYSQNSTVGSTFDTLVTSDMLLVYGNANEMFPCRMVDVFVPSWWVACFILHLSEMFKKLNIVAAFRRMHISPANNSYAWLPRKCDYRTDRHTHTRKDAGQSYPYVPLCFTGDTKMTCRVSKCLVMPQFHRRFLFITELRSSGIMNMTGW